MLCKYGCGQEAKHQFKNGNWCCSQHASSCPNVKNKIKCSHNTEEFIKKQSRALQKYYKNTPDAIEQNRKRVRKFYKNESPEQKLKRIEKHKKSHSGEQFIKNQSIKSKRTISQIKKRYPIFAIEEEMRYDPDKPGEREIQTRCKNHNCINSKEKDGWFTPTSSQIDNRMASLDRYGEGGSYLYCSDQCKNSCSLFNKRVSQLIEDDKITGGRVQEIQYTDSEYHVFRKEVLKRADYKCEYCGSKATIVHHSRPQKLEPFFALDPDYGIACCQDCHHQYGHTPRTECSTGSLANILCI